MSKRNKQILLMLLRVILLVETKEILYMAGQILGIQ